MRQLADAIILITYPEMSDLNEIICELVPLEEDKDATPTATRKVGGIPSASIIAHFGVKTNSVVVFQTVDGVIFRIDDFYLKANR